MGARNRKRTRYTRMGPGERVRQVSNNNLRHVTRPTHSTGHRPARRKTINDGPASLDSSSRCATQAVPLIRWKRKNTRRVGSRVAAFLANHHGSGVRPVRTALMPLTWRIGLVDQWVDIKTLVAGTRRGIHELLAV